MSKPNLQQRLEALIREMVSGGIRLEEALREFETQFIRKVLRDNGGNQCRTAACLGMHRNTLRNKLRRYGLL